MTRTNHKLAAKAAASLVLSREEAIDKLVDLTVAKWGEGERAAAHLMYAKYSHGLALNRLAYFDQNYIDQPMAAAAKRLMTAADRAVLRQGG